MQTVAFYTLGCKLNFSETSSIARDFEAAGYTRVDFEEGADVCVINTCSVTDNADKKCRAIVRRALRRNKDAFVAMIGCYAQLRPEEISNIPGVSIVLGASEKFNLPAHIEKARKGELKAVHGCEVMQVKDFKPAFSLGDRTRSFLKVQDGCDYFCAFCTIPMARGRSRSGTIDEIVATAREIAGKGVREVVLTGVNIGDFGRNTGQTFLELIRELDDVDGIERFRISSIEPNLLSEEIIAFVAHSKRFAPHFHVPLQSGSDVILKSMRRKYDASLYSERIRLIKKHMPHACIGVDVIVGFPGESDALFETTHAFLRALPLSYLHVFTYSERPGTTALRLEDSVPTKVRDERSKALHILSDKLRRKFYEDHLTENRRVLWEGEKESDLMVGFTDNYIKVCRSFNSDLINQTEDVYLDRIQANGWVSVRTAESAALYHQA
ncbi:MAG: tRNA (N(6)-L-threonylcarbamoyladenosine(37)-C(2))-methylthiotransferase MtaB [Flavobacteriales bacterium]|nr:tRNA (N(6)-L-threonylcarbamoyladenosine(37)-C(2))-methylthiotransferase MtaB [Flavobacteriales bacterium]MCB9448793.1 tRNA (N(6)-L-threonylcarbamoyladenosine(37)-C(2))-methylthiotransferase MtaB [Flavobacteriales bacterium]